MSESAIVTARIADGHVSLDRRGWPIVLAPPPPEPEQPAKPAPSSRPVSVDHGEWARRQDAVRDAAREFEPLADQDIKERLRGVTTKPLDEGSIAQFKVDVRHAKLDDLVDALDQRTRGALRGRRTVRVAMPKGYTQKTMRTLDQDEADQVEARLRARGWNDKQVKDDLHSKLKHLAPEPVVG